MMLLFPSIFLLLASLIVTCDHCSSSPVTAPSDRNAKVITSVLGNKLNNSEILLAPEGGLDLSHSYNLNPDDRINSIGVAASAVADEACTSDSNQQACICNLKDGSGLIDLTPLVQQTANDPLRGSNFKMSYYFVFCGVITGKPSQSNCNNKAAACEYSTTPITNTDIGDPSTARFEIRSNTENPVPIPALVMDTLTGNRRTVAYLHCDPAQTEDVKFVARGNQGNDPDGYTIYNMDLTSAYFCSVPVAGLSAGSILLIIFFSLLFVYLVGGVLVNAFYFKHHGTELIPNASFWADLPHLAKEGVLFAYNITRQCIDNLRHK